MPERRTRWERVIGHVVGRGDIKVVVEDTLNIVLVEENHHGTPHEFLVSDVERLIDTLHDARDVVREVEGRTQ